MQWPSLVSVFCNCHLLKLRILLKKAKSKATSFNFKMCLDFAPYLISHKTVQCVFQLSKKGLDYLITFKNKLVEHFCCIIRWLRKISIVHLLPFLSPFPFSNRPTNTLLWQLHISFLEFHFISFHVVCPATIPVFFELLFQFLRKTG